MRSLGEMRYEARYRRDKVSDNFWSWAGRAVPRRLAYWVLIAEGVRHIQDNEIVPEVPFTTVLNRSGRRARGK